MYCIREEFIFNKKDKDKNVKNSQCANLHEKNVILILSKFLCKRKPIQQTKQPQNKEVVTEWGRKP